MEFFLFLLYPAGFVSIVGGLFAYLQHSREGQRALKIAKANLTPVDDIAAGYAAVEASVKQLRAAKEAEDQLHIDKWEQEFYTEDEYKAVLEKRKHEKMLAEGKIKAETLTVDQSKFISSAVEVGDEWVPLGNSRHKADPDEELSYSQRRIQRAGAFVRDAPSDEANSLGTMVGGSVWRFDGWVKGKSVAGNNIWFYYIGEKSGIFKYVWSGATTNRGTSGMPYGGDHFDTETIVQKNAAGEVIVSHTGYIQMPVAEVARRITAELDYQKASSDAFKRSRNKPVSRVAEF
jgi:hypothetical protein